jgi:hypothetical protein
MHEYPARTAPELLARPRRPGPKDRVFGVGELSALLCDAVAGRTDIQAFLPILEQANPFSVPLDKPRLWFRYEHLFAELLRRRLKRELGEQMIPSVNQIGIGAIFAWGQWDASGGASGYRGCLTWLARD